MSGPKVASSKGGSTNGSASIPPSDRKLVASLKEVVPHTEEEIYAVLKECNKDPDETVQRLLSQETFHVVKRKRDKKKEITRDTSDTQSGSGRSAYSRSGGRGIGSYGSSGMGRGSSLLRAYKAEANVGRSKTIAAGDNGVNPSHKAPGAPLAGTMSYSQLVLPKSSASNDNLNHPVSNEYLLQQGQPSSLQGIWPGSSVPAAPALQGAWLGSGRGTVAEMLKAKSGSTYVTSSTMSEQQSLSSMPLDPSDPVLNPPLNPSIRIPVAKREVGAVGNQRYVGDRSSYAVQDASLHAENTVASVIGRDPGSLILQTANPSVSVPVGDLNKHSIAFLDASNQVHGIPEAPEVLNASEVDQFSNAPLYHVEELTELVESTSGVNTDAQLTTREGQDIDTVSDCTVGDEPLSATTAKIQELSLRDSHPVIIPDHIRVSEADCTMLSFGSFGNGFEGLSSNFAVEEKNTSFAAEEDASENDLHVIAAESTSSVTETTPTTILDQEQQSFSVPTQNLESVVDTAAPNNVEEIKKEDSFDQVSNQYATNYSTIDPVTSDRTNNYSSEGAETRQQDINPVLQPYDSSTYYSGVFRSAPDVDSRYSTFLPAASSIKNSVPNRLVTISSAQGTSSLESSGAAAFPSSSSVGGQTMQVMNNNPSTLTPPQQSMPVYATQPSGVPLGPFANVFSYPYMPPGFSYLQSPYQHNYMGTGNYHQVPSAVGGGAMKYPIPQYKTGGTVVGGMHTSVTPGNIGYGGYANSQQGSFPVNPPASSGNASSFDDGASQQFKETNLYMPNQQQMEGSSMWLQSQLARDLQGTSFYNLPVPSQNQQARYSQAQSLLSHAHPSAVYGNLYHQQPSSNPSPHQMLQQQPAVGSVGSLGTQIASYQQAQRAQQSWTNGF